MWILWPRIKGRVRPKENFNLVFDFSTNLLWVVVSVGVSINCSCCDSIPSGGTLDHRQTRAYQILFWNIKVPNEISIDFRRRFIGSIQQPFRFGKYLMRAEGVKPGEGEHQREVIPGAGRGGGKIHTVYLRHVAPESWPPAKGTSEPCHEDCEWAALVLSPHLLSNLTKIGHFSGRGNYRREREDYAKRQMGQREREWIFRDYRRKVRSRLVQKETGSNASLECSR